MIFLITNNAKVTLIRYAKHISSRSILFLLKIQENVFQLFLKIKSLHFVNKILDKNEAKKNFICQLQH